MELHNLTTRDHATVVVTVFKPEINQHKLLLINSATGVKQQVYYSFAKYFCQKGFTVITYDYRGVGLSKPSEMRGFNASMRLWGTEDFQSVTQFIRENYLAYQKYIVGHSIGALILGMNKDSEMFEKLIFVATQDAYIGNLTPKVALTAALGFGIALPLSTAILGYFPAHFFGLGESLPKGVAYDWQKLILHPQSTNRLYQKIPHDYSKLLSQKTFVLYAEDDTWITMKGMESLMNKIYPNLHQTYHLIKTEESPKKEIGHVNFFRSYNESLWKIILDQTI